MIVKMRKIKLVGLLSQRNAVVRRLMKLGVVEIAPVPLSDKEKEEVLQYAEYDDATVRINKIEEELRKIRAAITFLDSVVQHEKQPKKQMSFEAFVSPESYKGAWEKVFAANDLNGKINAKKNEINSILNTIEKLKLWINFPLPVQFNGTSQTSFAIGVMPANVDLSALANQPSMKLAQIELVSSDKINHYIYVFYHKSAQHQVMSTLKENAFTAVDFELSGSTIASNIKQLDATRSKNQSELEKLIKQARQLAGDMPLIHTLYDYIANMQERRKVRECFLKTQKAFIVGGWVPAEMCESVKKSLTNDFTVTVEFSDPGKDEDFPVAFKNNAFVMPFEAVTEMYSLPNSRTVDPNFLMSPFFFVFFGMMLGDAVYGLLMIAAGAYAMKKLQLTGIMDKLSRIMFWCGFSTFAFGALTGTWLGDFFPAALGINLAPIWFDPLQDPMRLLYISFGLGFLHIVVGMGIKAYMLVRDGHILDAVFDVGFWYLVLFGAAVIAGGMVLGETLVNVGTGMAIAGAAGLILTQGRNNKNIIMKFLGGVMSLYDVTGYISDILSYARILALGLATSVISQVFNTMGLLGGGFNSLLGAIMLIVVMVIGHVFNLAINLLGSFVHTSRLQYIEFYGKFYETGGVAFKPLKATTKYVELRE